MLIRKGQFARFLSNHRWRSKNNIFWIQNSQGPSKILFQSCGIYPKAKKNQHVNFSIREIFPISSTLRHHSLVNHSFASTYIYTFWKRENNPTNHIEVKNPQKMIHFFYFAALKIACFSILISRKISQNITENEQFNKKFLGVS